MSILVIVEYPVKPDRMDEFPAALAELLPDTRARDGCEAIEGYIDQTEASTYVMIERWAERSDHESYVAWRMETGTAGRIGEMMAGAPRMRYLEPDPTIDL